MRISEHSTDSVTILELLTPLTGDFSQQLFVPQIENMLEDGRRHFVFDMTELAWINSTGIGLLVGARRKIEDAGGRAVLAGVNDRVKDILKVVGLLAMWDVYPDPQRAVASFDGPAHGAHAEGSAG